MSDTPQHNPDWTTWPGIWVKGRRLCCEKKGRESEGDKLEIDFYQSVDTYKYQDYTGLNNNTKSVQPS